MRTEDSPRALLCEALNAAIFVASPYRRPVVGWMSDLDAMTPRRCARLLPALVCARQRGRGGGRRRRCGAGAAAGRKILRQHPGRPGAGAQAAHGAASRPACAASTSRRRPSQAYVALAFKVPQLTSCERWHADNDDALALTVLSAVLDGYSGARLDRALTQGDDRVADSAGACNGLIGPRPAAVRARRRAGRRARPPSRSRPRCARRSRKVAQRRRQRGRTRARQDPVGRQRGLQARLGDQPGARAGQQLGPGPAAGCRRAPDRAAARASPPTQVKAVAGKYFGDDQLTVAHPAAAAAGPEPQAAHARRGAALRGTDTELPVMIAMLSKI